MVGEVIRISVIGTGRMGYYHARLLSRLGLLDSVVDSNARVAKNVGQQFEAPWYTNLEALLEERSPNGAIIAVPTQLHSRIAIEVVQRIPELKALLIEKPITASVDDAIKLQSNLAKSAVKVIVGHIEVFNPVITRIKEIKNDNIIGNIRSALFQRRGAVGEARIETIGDVYQDVGIHDFDIALRLFFQGNIRLFSSAVKVNGIDNSSTIVISSEEDEFFATFLMSREYAGKLRTIDIEGTKGTLNANMLSQTLELRSLEIARGERDHSAIRIPFFSGERIKVYGEPLLLEMWNLIDCIQGKTNPLVSIYDGIKTLKLVEVARKSIRTGKVISFKI